MNTIKQSELIALIGLSSTNARLVDFFERHDLGKLPKSLTPNQGTKSIIYKPLNISFWFKYDIKNDIFQPPISPRNDNYKFVAYLSSILFTHVDHSNKRPDPKPQDFWDVLPSPGLHPQEIEHLIGSPLYENEVEKAYEKPEGKENILTIKYTKNGKDNISYSSWIAIREQLEIVNRDFFNRSIELESFPFLRRAYTAIIKWLFDSRFLSIDDNLYQLPLKAEQDHILDFVDQHLNSHLWKNQLKDLPYLPSFLYAITTNRKLTDPKGNTVSFYIRDIILTALDQKETFEDLYEDSFNAVDQFLNGIVFDDNLYKQLSILLTEKFNVFHNWKTNR
ncbi:hypothetical protein [Sphingobacterium paucimobilis]|uniref:Uncharacterized protein n=1 Tax=Sphingobacterium paucimobilis HER1398 TaxID=1346330 RepID=U2H7J8_9SPHI|nr:hypothetical protein [Sphingobacterium paucimobilis]ERJ57671.1 hypothetical protein M472_02710 [Sphingobacterium paucimobilis HER1398]